MRTSILIDDELMTSVLQLTGIKSKREAVNQGLKTLLALKQQEKTKQFKGALHWEGDLERRLG
jgi:Arc/MetJ family transcription regulator